MRIWQNLLKSKGHFKAFSYCFSCYYWLICLECSFPSYMTLCLYLCTNFHRNVQITKENGKSLVQGLIYEIKYCNFYVLLIKTLFILFICQKAVFHSLNLILQDSVLCLKANSQNHIFQGQGSCFLTLIIYILN